MTRLIPAIRALPPDIDAGIARCRLILSVLATGGLLLDPTRPQLPGWLGAYHAVLGIHIVTVAVFAAHLFYSSILYVLARQHALPSRLVAASIWTGVLFATAIGFATEGVASPFVADALARDLQYLIDDVSVRPEGEEIIIRIDDDGVGLPDETGYPWTIASRVRELGGRLRLLNDGAPGTHLEITLTPSMRRASEVSATRESRRRTKHVLDAAAA